MTLFCIVGLCYWVERAEVPVTEVVTVTIVAPCQDPPIPLVACEPQQ